MMLEEERIMKIDITLLPPPRQQYYANCQKEILARHASK
jgi:hypothetical protein